MMNPLDTPLSCSNTLFDLDDTWLVFEDVEDDDCHSNGTIFEYDI